MVVGVSFDSVSQVFWQSGPLLPLEGLARARLQRASLRPVLTAAGPDAHAQLEHYFTPALYLALLGPYHAVAGFGRAHLVGVW